MNRKYHIKVAMLRAAIVLVPSYLMAYLTDKMVYVVPTLVAAGFFAATLNFQDSEPTTRVDEDGGEAKKWTNLIWMDLAKSNIGTQ